MTAVELLQKIGSRVKGRWTVNMDEYQKLSHDHRLKVRAYLLWQGRTAGFTSTATDLLEHATAEQPTVQTK